MRQSKLSITSPNSPDSTRQIGDPTTRPQKANELSVYMPCLSVHNHWRSLQAYSSVCYACIAKGKLPIKCIHQCCQCLGSLSGLPHSVGGSVPAGREHLGTWACWRHLLDPDNINVGHLQAFPPFLFIKRYSLIFLPSLYHSGLVQTKDPLETMTALKNLSLIKSCFDYIWQRTVSSICCGDSFTYNRMSQPVLELYLVLIQCHFGYQKSISYNCQNVCYGREILWAGFSWLSLVPLTELKLKTRYFAAGLQDSHPRLAAITRLFGGHRVSKELLCLNEEKQSTNGWRGTNNCMAYLDIRQYGFY